MSSCTPLLGIMAGVTGVVIIFAAGASIVQINMCRPLRTSTEPVLGSATREEQHEPLPKWLPCLLICVAAIALTLAVSEMKTYFGISERGKARDFDTLSEGYYRVVSKEVSPTDYAELMLIEPVGGGEAIYYRLEACWDYVTTGTCLWRYRSSESGKIESKIEPCPAEKN